MQSDGVGQEPQCAAAGGFGTPVLAALGQEKCTGTAGRVKVFVVPSRARGGQNVSLCHLK